jgi:hypothetical protein
MIDHPDYVILINIRKQASFYVYLVKEMFHKDNHEFVELHAVSDQNINTLVIATEMITRFGYAEIIRIKTKQVFSSYNNFRLPKLMVSMKKSEDFESLY